MGFSYQEEKSESKVKKNICEVDDIWQILGKRWSLTILKHLSSKKSMIFSELLKKQSGLTNTVLSERLFKLESEGLIQRKIYPTTTPK